ncbi:MAG: hypothetical protein Q8R79_04000 [Legionellaceae bacterium]|nr:hypothetical protein [Legionellaceae bacterium]
MPSRSPSPTQPPSSAVIEIDPPIPSSDAGELEAQGDGGISAGVLLAPQLPTPQFPFIEFVVRFYKLGGAKSLDVYGLMGLLWPVAWSKVYPDPKHLASIPVAATYYNFLMITSLSGLFAANILISILLGRLNNERLTKAQQDEIRANIVDVYHANLLYTVITASFVMLALYKSSFILVNGCFQDPEVAEDAQEWLRGTIFGVVPTFLYIGSEQILASFQQSKAILAGVRNFLISLAIGAFLLEGPLQCNPRWVVPLVFSLQPTLTSISFTRSLRLPGMLGIPFFEGLPFNIFYKWKVLGNSLKTSSVISAAIVCEMLYSFALVSLSATVDLPTQEAYAVPTQVSLFNISIAVNLALTSMIFLFQTEKKYIYPTAVYGWGLALLPSVIIPTVAVVSHQWIFNLLNIQDVEVQRRANQMLPFTSAFEVFKTYVYIFLFQLRTKGDAWTPVLIHTIGLLAGLMLALFCTKVLSLEGRGIVIGQAFGTGVIALQLAKRWNRAMASSREDFEAAQEGSLIKPVQTACQEISQGIASSCRSAFFSREPSRTSVDDASAVLEQRSASVTVSGASPVSLRPQ